jgi:hypothetical protein
MGRFAVWSTLRGGEQIVSNGMNAPTRNGIDVPKWRR